MTGKFANAIRGKEAELTSLLDVEHGLWLHLKDAEILTDWQIEECKRAGTKYNQAAKLLELLPPVEDKYYELFDKALEKTKQGRVRAILQANLAAVAAAAATVAPPEPPFPTEAVE